MGHRDAEVLQDARIADAGKFQQLRRLRRTRRKNDLRPRLETELRIANARGDPGCPLSIEIDGKDMRPGSDAEVLALHCRLQIGFGGTDAAAAALVHLIVAEAILAFAVVVGIARITGLFGSPDEGLADPRAECDGAERQETSMRP